MRRAPWPAAAWVGAGLLFALLATANGAGYRYGGSDQAFYIPAIARALQPLAFPRDAPLIDAQARLILVDEVLAAVVRHTGASVDALFLAGYLLSLALTWAGIVLIGTRVYTSPWTTVALGAACTLRHRISLTSANSFEPYFHPRMLAFAVGLLAIAALLRRRPWLAITLVAASAVVHATTAVWFAGLVGVALGVLDPRLRRVVVGGAALVIAFLAWAVVAGPLRQAWAVMDPIWLQAVASKDSLFADQWPAWAWAANLGTLALLWVAHLARRRRGSSRPEDEAMAWGATALVALFLLTLPAVAARLSLVVEFQVSRVFWLVDLLATVYALAALTELTRHRQRAAGIAAALLVGVSAARGVYIGVIEHPERPLFAVHLPASPWQDAMGWIARQPLSVHVLADPGHAWKYGTSVRVSGGRDVFLEEVKDSALAMYSRDVAVRVVERTAAVGDFLQMTGPRARDLSARYDITYLVTEADLPLPMAYRNSQFRIYTLQ